MFAFKKLHWPCLGDMKVRKMYLNDRDVFLCLGFSAENDRRLKREARPTTFTAEELILVAKSILEGYRYAGWPADSYNHYTSPALRSICNAISGSDIEWKLGDCLKMTETSNWVSTSQITLNVANVLKDFLRNTSADKHAVVDERCPFNGRLVSSPNYSIGGKNNVACSRLFYSDMETLVSLNFSMVQLDSNSEYCDEQYDHLKITRFWQNMRLYTEFYCGSSIPPLVLFDSNQVLLEYFTNELEESTGFMATVYYHKTKRELFSTISLATVTSNTEKTTLEPSENLMTKEWTFNFTPPLINSSTDKGNKSIFLKLCL